MEMPAETPSIGQDLDRRWLWAARLTALAAFLLVLMPLFVPPILNVIPPEWIANHWRWEERAELLLAWSPWWLALPYCWIVLCLFTTEPKKGLAVAVGIAPLGLALPALVLLGARAILDLFWALGVVSLAAAVLVSALKASSTLRHEPAGRRMFRKRAWYWRCACLLFLLIVSVATLNVPDKGGATKESVAASALRTLNTAAVTYQSTYENGYPPSLAALKTPPLGAELSCKNADLIDARLARGQVRGYVIQYNPGPPIERPAAGCPAGVKSYTITARPVTHGQSGTLSFFTDESGVIRATTENRVATAQDPPL